MLGFTLVACNNASTTSTSVVQLHRFRFLSKARLFSPLIHSHHRRRVFLNIALSSTSHASPVPRSPYRSPAAAAPARPTAPAMSTSSVTTSADHTRTHAGHSHAGHHHHHHHHHGDNAYLTSKNKNDPGVRITRIGLYVNLGMAIAKGAGGYVFNSKA